MIERGRNTEDEAFPPLPPPFSPGQGGQDDADFLGNGDEDGNEEGDVSRLAEVPAAKRKGVKRPQPKLDSQRLTSERGLPALRTLFDDVHFKGKGHEASDLQLLMQKMENWAHRLFPKLQFENFIDKLEKLGNKKDVQTCLKRIRLDMPLTHEDFIGKDEEGQAADDLHIFGEADPFSGAGFIDEGPILSTPAPSAPPPSATVSPSPPSITGEQQRRMELSRQRALEKRLARQQQHQQETGPTDSQGVDTLEVEPTSSAKHLDQSDHPVELEPENGIMANKPPSTDSVALADSSLPEEEEGERHDHPITKECEDD